MCASGGGFAPDALASVVDQAVQKLKAERKVVDRQFRLVVTRGSTSWCVSFIFLPETPDDELVVFVFDDGRVRMMGEAPR